MNERTNVYIWAHTFSDWVHKQTVVCLNVSKCMFEWMHVTFTDRSEKQKMQDQLEETQQLVSELHRKCVQLSQG